MYKQDPIERREFLKYAAGAVAGVATLGLASKLEGIAEAASSKNTRGATKTNSDFPVISTDSIADKISKALNQTKVGLSPLGYRRAFDLYNFAIEDAIDGSNQPNIDDRGKMRYDGLNIIASMEQARLLRELANSNVIVPGEEIRIKGLPRITSNRQAGDSYKIFNYLKALENYQAVEAIFEKAQGRTFPKNLGIRILPFEGKIIDREFLYGRMIETINLVMNDYPDSYASKLASKKSEVEKKLKDLRRVSERIF